MCRIHIAVCPNSCTDCQICKYSTQYGNYSYFTKEFSISLINNLWFSRAKITREHISKTPRHIFSQLYKTESIQFMYAVISWFFTLPPSHSLSSSQYEMNSILLLCILTSVVYGCCCFFILQISLAFNLIAAQLSRTYRYAKPIQDMMKWVAKNRAAWGWESVRESARDKIGKSSNTIR